MKKPALAGFFMAKPQAKVGAPGGGLLPPCRGIPIPQGRSPDFAALPDYSSGTLRYLFTSRALTAGASLPHEARRYVTTAATSRSSITGPNGGMP